ncbi:phosphotransferase family protein [Gymnodinialimonas sp.]
MSGKRATPTAPTVDRALQLAQQGMSGAEIDRILGIAAPEKSVEVTKIPRDVLAEIARDVFGAATRITDAQRLGPVTRHGLARRGGFTGNLIYKLTLSTEASPIVVRFNRGLRQDVFVQEQQNYADVRAATGVRGPDVLHVDRSLRLAPTEFMVMEHITGELAGFLTHPDNPEVTDAQKADIHRDTGQFFADLHRARKPQSDGRAEERQVLFGIYRLQEVAARHADLVDPALVAEVIAALQNSPSLQCADPALCFMDADLLFQPEGDGWRLAHVCDLEWVCYRSPNVDLASQLCPQGALWALETAGIEGAALDQVRRNPFFATYGAHHSIDWHRLLENLVHYQLSLWGHAIADQPTPEAQTYLLGQRGDLIRNLMLRICATAT